MCNGASPLVLDNARHNSALHWAASCCRADCVGRLLGSGAIFQMQSEQLIAIAGAFRGLVCCPRWRLSWSVNARHAVWQKARGRGVLLTCRGMAVTCVLRACYVWTPASAQPLVFLRTYC